ncbi:MAG: hypothetical protein HRT35_04030 [Algicola sp.]|nr:hypothetical protein [Algicola sp.]
MGYTLACPGGAGDTFHHQKGVNFESSWFHNITYAYVDISNEDSGSAYVAGYPARNTYTEVLATGKAAVCTIQAKDITGFSSRSISGAITGWGFGITGAYLVPAVTLTSIKPDETKLYPPHPPIGGGGCAVQSPNCEDDDHNYDYQEDPLLIDLGQDGIHLGDAGVGVNFDMYGDGNQTLMQWVQYGGNEAFLVNDLNNNGVIDNGMELFGTGTHMLPLDMTQQWPDLNQSNVASIRFAAAPELAPNGFVALAQYDQPALGGNDDGYISSKDEIWSGLSLWLDNNADGVSTIDEMLQLSEVGITRLDIIPKQNNRQDPAGNSIPLWSWAVDENNTSHNKYKMVDVFFRTLTP